MFAAEHISEKVLAKLRADSQNKAAIIGSIVSDHPGKVVIKSKVGGKRIVSMPSKE